MQNTIDFLHFQIAHYTQLLAEAPAFVVTPQGIEFNPAKRFRRERLYNLKKQLQA